MSNTLFLSSDKIFHTLEGEGKNIGKPAVFMRLSMCNLTCKGWATPENPNGCDSKVAWVVKNKMTFEEICVYCEQRGYDVFLKRGDIFKITGGEPLLQQTNLIEFCTFAAERWHCRLNIEFETNATLMPDIVWRNGFNAAFVCSPKLSNNGDPVEKRYKQDVLKWHAFNSSSTFKFVVTNEDDLSEIECKYLTRFLIANERVWLMPECATTKQFKEKAPWVAEICKKHNFNFSPRLQILIWEQALGV